MEVHSTLLAVYSLDNGGQSILCTYYVVLPGAEISLLEDGTLPTWVENGGQGSEEHPHRILPPLDNGKRRPRCVLEIRPCCGARPELFRAQRSSEAARWHEVLTAQARTHGGGHLMFHTGGWWPLTTATWRRLYCVVVSADNERGNGTADRECGPRLVGFAAPRDCAEGRAPQRVWRLDTVSVRPLSGQGASSKALELARGVPAGLELEDYETGACWHFACDSARQQSWWLEALRKCTSHAFASDQPNMDVADEASTRQENEGKLEELHPVKIFDITASDDAEDTGDLNPVTGSFGGESHAALSDIFASVMIVADKPASALSQLKRLESELAGAIDQWRQTLETTEAACNHLLRFFGLESSGGSGSAAPEAAVGTAAKQLLEALAEFVRQVREAWLDLEKHAKSDAARCGVGKHRRRSLPTTPLVHRKGGFVRC